MAKETGRQCKRCGYAWYATQPKGKPSKPRWFDETGAFWTDGQARMARRVSNYERSQAAYERWGRCPNCGSEKVTSDRSKTFTPTGAVASRAPAAQVPPAPATPSRSSDSASVWTKIAAFHGKHWRIIWAVVFIVAPFGSLGDPEVYPGPLWLDALKFAGIFVAGWAVGGYFLRLHFRRRLEMDDDHESAWEPDREA